MTGTRVCALYFESVVSYTMDLRRPVMEREIRPGSFEGCNPEEDPLGLGIWKPGR